jgi:mannose/cellobiose epimerase-like protein (N-acyl-D-glucosamine 2-epimerase family)
VGPRSRPDRLSPAGLRERFRRHLRDDILGFWARAVDREAGGFFTDLDNRGRPRGPQRRFVVHVARLVWAFSAAHRAGEGDYLDLAGRAAESLDSLWDARRGGWFQEADRSGEVVDRRKTQYGQAFGILAMAEHSLASGSESARRRAEEAVELLLARGRASHGRFHTGWTEFWQPDGHPGPDPNSHLHVMEALVPLVELTGDAGHRDLLRECCDLLRDRMLIPTEGSGLRLADRLGPDWRPAAGPEGLRESYGHGIETAWLLLQATEVLGRPLEDIMDASRGLADRALAVGLDRRWGGMFFRGTADRSVSDSRKVWWVQAEGLVGALRLHRDTGDPRYLAAFEDLARWVDRRQADHRYGEWFAILDRHGLRKSDGRKGHRWKSAYHTGRACLEVIRLLS